MGRLIYGMMMSLDGYTEDANGKFDWAMPDEEVHAHANELAKPVGTNLYGRRMYDTMVYWETADQEPDQPPVYREWTQQWKASDKIVYSRTITEPRSERTRVERDFDPDAVRRLKAESPRDITVSGPTLAAEALRHGLVDELQQIIFPVVVGGGRRFFPDSVRFDAELVEERRFASGVVSLRYNVRSA